ncbi:MAG: hypothetical protein K6F05_04930 [Succinivibrio sp.]|nr:hypothetical protein [Succinivibrio sp.]
MSSIKEYQANFEISEQEIEQARVLLRQVHEQTLDGIKAGKGPFCAAVYQQHKFILATSNSVVEEQCALNHAEMNAIRAACLHYKSFDLAPFELSLYINAEPCIMCLGGIMWSGIKQVFFSVPSSQVEEITGFDEGFKPHWFEEFARRKIKVCGGLEAELGRKVLRQYVAEKRPIYKPTR